MKKLLLIALLSGTSSLDARLVIDPLTKTFWSEPRATNINLVEYYGLFQLCIKIEQNMTVFNNGILPAKKYILEQYIYFLKSIGTPTALRLIEDFKENKMYSPNGSVLMNFYE